MQRPKRVRITERLPRFFTKLGVGTALLVLVLLAGALLVGFVRLAWTEHQINQAIARQESANAAQIALNQQLKGQADYAESDGAIEQAARDRLGMAKDGDTVLRPNLVPPSTAVAPTPTPPLTHTLDTPAITQVASLPPRSATATNALEWWHALFPPPDAQP
ncbi:MAG: septum formation initiator family protein [Herpetosiphonaceae bacterium]|nr:septum formation initiator family protein [Herpetosiphonaceae bacterium]